MSKSNATAEPRRPAEISINRLKSGAGLSTRRIEQAVRLAAGERAVRSISVTLGDDDALALLHDRYLADPRPTDVLSFDLRDDPADERLEGEIVVSVDAARREAARRRIPLELEVLRYVVHGTLHLRGYDDRTAAQRQRMKREEDRVLRRLSAGSKAQK